MQVYIVRPRVNVTVEITLNKAYKAILRIKFNEYVLDLKVYLRLANTYSIKNTFTETIEEFHGCGGLYILPLGSKMESDIAYVMMTQFVSREKAIERLAGGLEVVR